VRCPLSLVFALAISLCHILPYTCKGPYLIGNIKNEIRDMFPVFKNKVGNDKGIDDVGEGNT